jgi:hypothetical protein
LYPAAQRSIQVSQRLSVNFSVRIPTMPALKVLDGVHERTFVNRPIRGDIGVSRKVAD